VVRRSTVAPYQIHPLHDLATNLIALLPVAPALSVELFRYRGATKDGGTLEYIFESDE